MKKTIAIMLMVLVLAAGVLYSLDAGLQVETILFKFGHHGAIVYVVHYEGHTFLVAAGYNGVDIIQVQE